MDDESLSSDLTETERGEETSLDTIGLDRFRGVEEVLERAKLLRDVVRVTVNCKESRQPSAISGE